MKNFKEIYLMYLDFVCNFLTVGAFADYYAIPDQQAKDIIHFGHCYLRDVSLNDIEA